MKIFQFCKGLLIKISSFKLNEIGNKLDLIIKKQGEIMTTVKEYGVKANEHFDKIETGIQGLTDDIKTQQDLIKKLQDSVGGSLSPEDQATLDALDARTSAASDKITALDALTPPPLPTGTETGTGAAEEGKNV